MNKPLFIQLHTLTSYPGVLLNRDDVGFAKRIPFGGAVRTRISSQCLKRHYRTFTGEHSLASLSHKGSPVGFTIRSRHVFERLVLAPLLSQGTEPTLAHAATEAVMAKVLGEHVKNRKKGDTRGEDSAAKGKKTPGRKAGEEGGTRSLVTGQIAVLGRPEVEFFLAEARALAKMAGSASGIEAAKKKRFTKEWGKNLDGLVLGAGLDAALFGRMVTSDKLARADAAVHIAHAFTVHGEHAETDYFSAVDDLLRDPGDPQLESAHVGNAELTSGLFYGYTVVDVPQLVSNLEGCEPQSFRKASRELSASVVKSLVHLLARVSPGAKKGSTAPYAYAHMVLVEVGSSQPRTLANAFLAPVADRPDLLANTYDALTSYLTDVDQMYGLDNRRAISALGPKDRLFTIAPSVSLDAVASFAASSVLGPS